MANVHRSYTVKEKFQVLLEMESKNLIPSEMAKQSGVPYRTLMRWIQLRDRIKTEAGSKTEVANIVQNADVPILKARLLAQLDYIEKIFIHYINPSLERVKNLTASSLAATTNNNNFAANPLVTSTTSTEAMNITNIVEKMQRREEDIIKSLELILKVEDAKATKEVDGAEVVKRRRDIQRFYEKALIQREKLRIETARADLDRGNLTEGSVIIKVNDSLPTAYPITSINEKKDERT